MPAPLSGRQPLSRHLQGVTVVAAAGTPVALSAVSERVKAIEIHARLNFTTANTGAVYVGFSKTAGQNFRVLLPGESFSLSAPRGKALDLAGIYIDAANSADAVTFTALE